jgi:hypothetical protein
MGTAAIKELETTDVDYLYERGYMRGTEDEEKLATLRSLQSIATLGSPDSVKAYDLLSIMDGWRFAECLECDTWFLRTSGNSHNSKHACRKSGTPIISVANFPDLRRWHFIHDVMADIETSSLASTWIPTITTAMQAGNLQGRTVAEILTSQRSTLPAHIPTEFYDLETLVYADGRAASEQWWLTLAMDAAIGSGVHHAGRPLLQELDGINRGEELHQLMYQVTNLLALFGASSRAETRLKKGGATTSGATSSSAMDPRIVKLDHKMILMGCSFSRPCPLPHLLVIGKGDKHSCLHNTNPKGNKVRTPNNVVITKVSTLFDLPTFLARFLWLHHQCVEPLLLNPIWWKPTREYRPKM